MPAGETLRMRVFAGPNGSGKSTVIKKVRTEEVNGRSIDFGIYVNADDIAGQLKNKPLSFRNYSIETSRSEFQAIALASGLINHHFNKKTFSHSYTFTNNSIKLRNVTVVENLAQIIADFLRKKLLAEKKRFSFETVFSHPGKLDIMRQAANAGYKVYLYFVSTESPDINVERVAARHEDGGHDVPEDKIRSRYERSLNMLYEASQIAYQAFYFDNSVNGADAAMFAHFKKGKGGKVWDDIHEDMVPAWFQTYYSDKIPATSTQRKKRGK